MKGSAPRVLCLGLPGLEEPSPQVMFRYFPGARASCSAWWTYEDCPLLTPVSRAHQLQFMCFTALVAV
jgi:hypothetical protein